MTEYNKLVRDHIPEIIRRDNLQCDITTLNEEEFRQALRIKLQEEAQEAAEADPDDLITELADLYEVIDTIMATCRIEPEAVRNMQIRRRQERGGFTQRICLLRTYPWQPDALPRPWGCCIDPEAVRNMQIRRRQEHGGFTQRIRLLRTYP